MGAYEDRDVDGFYKSTLFSNSGKLFQLAYADKSANDSPFRLFLRSKKGWYIFDKGSRHFARKVADDEACPVLKSNSLEHQRDSRLGLLVTYYGHWYSRAQNTKLIDHILDSCPSKNHTPPASLLRSILMQTLTTGDSIYPEQPSLKDDVGHREAISQPHPPRGHVSITIGSAPVGVMIYPSAYHEVASILSIGGGAPLKRKMVADEVLDGLKMSEDMKQNYGPTLDRVMDEQTIDALLTSHPSEGDTAESMAVSYFCDTSHEISEKGHLVIRHP